LRHFGHFTVLQRGVVLCFLGSEAHWHLNEL